MQGELPGLGDWISLPYRNNEGLAWGRGNWAEETEGKSNQPHYNANQIWELILELGLSWTWWGHKRVGRGNSKAISNSSLRRDGGSAEPGQLPGKRAGAPGSNRSNRRPLSVPQLLAAEVVLKWKQPRLTAKHPSQHFTYVLNLIK